MRSGFASISDFRQVRPSCPFDGFTFPTASPHCSVATHIRCRTMLPACHRLRLWCPRLRTRLTLGRLTLPRNPQAFGVSGSCRHLRYSFRHSHFSSLHQSLQSGFSDMRERSPTIVPLGQSRASVPSLSLLTLSVPLHSTSELLRTLSKMAASKPTSWLSLRADSLSH